MTGVGVRVQRVIMPSGVESTTVLREGVVVEPVDRFLAHLTAIERSPNTVKAYAHDLRDFFAFLESRELDWTRVTLEDVGRFVAWLRLPGEVRGGGVALLPWVEGDLCAATVNRKLSGLASFYEFHQRHGVDLADLLTRWRPGWSGRLVAAVFGPPRASPGAAPSGGVAHRTTIGTGADRRRDDDADRGLRSGIFHRPAGPAASGQ